MHECRELDALLILLKRGFAAQVLFERVELADKQVARGGQGTRRFGEDKGEICDMFKHQVAGDQIRRLVGTRPGLREIGFGEGHRGTESLGPGLRKHARRKIEAMHPATDLGEQARVLAGAAAKLQDGYVVPLGQGGARNQMIEIAC